MKSILNFVFILFSLTMIFSCQQSEDKGFLAPEEMEISKRDYISQTAVKNPKEYCVWTVTGVEAVTEGAVCKYSIGDKICYRCNEDGCSTGIISVGKNFGDGCRTFGELTDSSCEEREDCAGKYVG